MRLKLLKLKNINPFWKRSFIGFSCLGIFAWACTHFFDHKSPILTSSAQEKADNLTPIERVKSLHESAQLKNDPIADINTQKLLSKSISKNLDPLKINLDAKEDKNLPLNLNQEHNLSNAAKENACDPYDAALGKCPLSKEYQENMDIIAQKISLQTKPSLKDANTNGSAKNSTQIEGNYTDVTSFSVKENLEKNKENNIQEANLNMNTSETPLSLLISSGGKTEVLGGRTADIGGADNQIKAGTTVLAVINEAKTITSAGEQYASASILGAPFDRKKFPEGVTVLLKMKLNGTQDGIEGQIIGCSSHRNNDKTLSCAGELEDINGESALRGEMYSSTGWQIITTAATTFLSGLSLAKITTSATQIGTTVDQSSANALYKRSVLLPPAWASKLQLHLPAVELKYLFPGG